MRRVLVTIFILAVLATTSTVGAPKKTASPEAPPTRPIAVVFDTTVGQGADKALAASATRAVCSYLRNSQRVEAVAFNRESPTVQRAIMDKQLTADQVASYSSQDERIAVAKALSYDYAAGAEVSIKDNQVAVKLWVAKVDGGKKDRWEETTQASAGSSGMANYDNAMQSATSASVIKVSRQAFQGLPIVVENGPTTGAETTALGSDLIAAPTAPGAADYVARADANLKASNVAGAIQQYQLAVNADPTNSAIRMLLVDAFAQKGVYHEATAELHRAELMGASAGQVAAKEKLIEAMQTGSRANRADPIPAATQSPVVDTGPGTETQPAKVDTPVATGAPKSAVAQMLAGDKLWRENKPDEAADAYKEAIKLNPSDWRAHERLALVAASISMFGESRLAMEQLAKIQPDPSPAVLAKRYSLFSTIFAQWFAMLLKQYDDDSADHAKRVINRESYYSSIKGLNGRLDSMAKFLDVLPVPSDRKSIALHRSLACGLLLQGVSSLQDYLETNSKDSKLSADTFIAQAKKELEAAKTLEAKMAATQNELQPTPPTPPATRQDTTPTPAPDQPAPNQDDSQPASPAAPGSDQDQPPPDQPGTGGNANPQPVGDVPM